MEDSTAGDARFEELKQRWEADKTSRIFAHVAEEYRRRDAIEDALEVLEIGLKSHPESVAAKVVLGRCLLEVGRVEEARETLAGVVAKDPTNLVATSLLTSSHARFGDFAQARELLDRCRLLGVPGEEIEALEAEIAGRAVAEGGSPRADEAAADAPTSPPEPPLLAPAPESPTDALRALEPSSATIAVTADGAGDDAVIVLPHRQPMPMILQALPERRPRALVGGSGMSPFGSGQIAVPETARESSPDDIFQLPGAVGVGAASLAEVAEIVPTAAEEEQAAIGRPPEVAAEIPLETVTAEELPAEELSPAEAVVEELNAEEPVATEEILEEPVAEGPALLEAVEEELSAPEATPEVSVVEVAQDADLEAPPEKVVEEILPEELIPPPLPAEEEPTAESEPTPEVPAEVVASGSATLAELYLRQGHLEDAEGEFQAVLAREPDHEAAKAGLQMIHLRRRGPVTADELLAGAEPAAGLTSRKISVLNRYLEILRQGARRHVS